MRYIAIILMLICCENLIAQGFYNKGALVSVSAGTVLSVPDSIVNNGTLINNGQIIISGAWVNTGTYDAGTGQIEFDSDIDQAINHNAQSIEKLVISGGGKKEFLADIFIQSGLTLDDGILVSKNGARIVMDQDVVVTGGSDASHIMGPVERKGSGDWLFPIGNGLVYLPVVISDVSGSSTFGIMTMHEMTTGEVLNPDPTLEYVSTRRYWELASGGGDLTGAKITLPVVGENSPVPTPDNITIGAANVVTGPYTDLHRSAFDGETITSGEAPVFKYYAIASAQLDHSIEVFNAVSSGSDGKNDFMTIRNIEFYQNNKVLIFNRWGDRVFEMSGYDNNRNVFMGMSSSGNKLPSGTYYYSIDLGDGSEKKTGYVVLR